MKQKIVWGTVIGLGLVFAIGVVALALELERKGSHREVKPQRGETTQQVVPGVPKQPGSPGTPVTPGTQIQSTKPEPRPDTKLRELLGQRERARERVRQLEREMTPEKRARLEAIKIKARKEFARRYKLGEARSLAGQGPTPRAARPPRSYESVHPKQPRFIHHSNGSIEGPGGIEVVPLVDCTDKCISLGLSQCGSLSDWGGYGEDLWDCQMAITGDCFDMHCIGN